MAVTYKTVVKSSSLSNKPEGEKVYIDDVLYMTNVSDSDIVYIRTPRINQLSIVFPVKDPEAQDSIVATLVCLAKDNDGPEFLDALFKSSYENNVHLTGPGSGAPMLIQAKPKNSKLCFLRCEFNPDKRGTNGLEFFKGKLTNLLLGEWTYGHLAVHGRVTRVEMACDVVNCSVKKLIIRSAIVGKSHSYFRIDADVEAIYLAIAKGKTSSKHYVYNKRQKLRDADR